MLKSTTYTFGTVLGIYLFGLGAGGVTGTIIAKRVLHPTRVALALQAGIGLDVAGSLLALGSIVIGSREPIAYDRETVLARLHSPFAQTHYARMEIDVNSLVRSFLEKERTRMFGPDADRSRLRDTNTDLFPRGEYHVRRRRDPAPPR